MGFLLLYFAIGVVFMYGTYDSTVDAKPDPYFMVTWPITAAFMVMELLVLIGKFLANYKEGIKR